MDFVFTEMTLNFMAVTLLAAAVSLLGADLRIESEFGVGTTVYFELALNAFLEDEPVQDVLSQPMEPLDESHNPSKIRLLIAEDDPINAKLLKAMLLPFGYKLKLVTNGLQAVEAAQEWRPHLIWMDIRMPVMDGREAAQQIRSLSSVEQWSINPVIIALTADVQQSDQSQYTLSGFDHVMIKPCLKKDLIDAIRSYVTSENNSNQGRG
ncbi:MAG: response regulator [Verrucomicrobia bacterium]|jgi:CheY-like chemotaxis protein|nr:response regulator [Verrucomicrobiota bacterium]